MKVRKIWEEILYQKQKIKISNLQLKVKHSAE